MSAPEDDYLSVTEAAAVLHVAPSTIRRWIRAGELPASRIGNRRIALRMTDLSSMVRPAQVNAKRTPSTIYTDAALIPRLTPREIADALQTLERLQRNAKELVERLTDTPLRPSLEIIHETREERTRQLG